MLVKLLKEKKKLVVNDWLDMILKAYPADTARFMRSDSNEFSNPVGNVYIREIENIYDAFLDNRQDEKLLTAIDRIMEIRAVQEFSPAKALSVFFLLKQAIRKYMGEEFRKAENYDEWIELEGRIDGLALLGFERYTHCREKIYSIKLNEAKKSVARFMERFGANIIVEEPQNDEVFKMAINDNNCPKGGAR